MNLQFIAIKLFRALITMWLVVTLYFWTRSRVPSAVHLPITTTVWPKCSE